MRFHLDNDLASLEDQLTHASSWWWWRQSWRWSWLWFHQTYWSYNYKWGSSVMMMMMMMMTTMQWWWRQTNMREHARFYLWPKLPLRWGPPGQPSPILRDDVGCDDWWYFPGRFFSTSNFHWLRSRWTSVGFSANVRSINITTGGWGNRHQYTQITYYHQNHQNSATSSPIWIICT